MFFQKLFFKSSLRLNGWCGGIQVHPSNSSDDLCLLFCLILLGQAYPCLGHDRAAGGYAICPGLEVVLILLAAAEDEGLAAPALHVEEEPLELCGAYHCVTYFFLIIS